MQNSLSLWIAVPLLVMVSPYYLAAPDSGRLEGLSKMEQVIVFAIQLEVQASHLRDRTDVCVVFSPALSVNATKIIKQLKRDGIAVHPNEWCNRRPRGITIAVLACTAEMDSYSYSLTLEVGDARPIAKGEHFAALLRRGNYLIRHDGTSKPRLKQYQETCCEQ